MSWGTGSDPKAPDEQREQHIRRQNQSSQRFYDEEDMAYDIEFLLRVIDKLRSG